MLPLVEGDREPVRRSQVMLDSTEDAHHRSSDVLGSSPALGLGPNLLQRRMAVDYRDRYAVAHTNGVRRAMLAARVPKPFVVVIEVLHVGQAYGSLGGERAWLGVSRRKARHSFCILSDVRRPSNVYEFTHHE